MSAEEGALDGGVKVGIVEDHERRGMRIPRAEPPLATGFIVAVASDN